MIPLLNAPIRLLLCKLDPGTAERALFELEHAGMAVDFRSVNSLDEFTACVPGAAYDLIISEDADDTARAFDLIGVTRDLGVDTPVLLITPATDASRSRSSDAGADWIADDCLARLPVAARRMVDDARIRSERAIAERRFMELVDGVSEVLFSAEPKLKELLHLNPALLERRRRLREVRDEMIQRRRAEAAASDAPPAARA